MKWPYSSKAICYLGLYIYFSNLKLWLFTNSVFRQTPEEAAKLHIYTHVRTSQLPPLQSATDTETRSRGTEGIQCDLLRI